MDGGICKNRSLRGGILGLIRTIEEHDRALEYDLMTRTGRTLNEYMNMGAAGKVALISFIQYLPPDAALPRERDPKNEMAEWCTTLKTNAILADIFDVFAAVHTKKGDPKIEYPRPNKKRTIGRDAIPISKFWNWWDEGEK